MSHHPPRWRDRFKRVVTAAKTEKDRRIERAEDRSFERELDKLCPPSNSNGHKSIYVVGTRVRVVRAYRGFNSRYIGKVGYVVERHSINATFDVAVKFIKKKNPDVSKIRELPGSIGDFRGGELELV